MIAIITVEFFVIGMLVPLYWLERKDRKWWQHHAEDWREQALELQEMFTKYLSR